MALDGLDGTVAVIVGGASGLGSATARRLGREGCRVIVGDIAVDGAERTADAIRAEGGQAVALPCDLSDPASVGALFTAAVKSFGRVDSTFNVGADMSTLSADIDVVDIDLDVWDRVMSVNRRLACRLPPLGRGSVDQWSSGQRRRRNGTSLNSIKSNHSHTTSSGVLSGRNPRQLG